MEISQSGGGLMFAFARGMTAVVTRDYPPALRRYPMPARYVSSSPGREAAEAAVEHRIALTGDFEVEVEFD